MLLPNINPILEMFSVEELICNINKTSKRMKLII